MDRNEQSGIVDLLNSQDLRQRRYRVLLKTGQGACVDLNQSVCASEDDNNRLFEVDEGRLRKAFQLYLARLACFKTRMDMTSSRINDEKIAALTCVCLMEMAPIKSIYDPDPDTVHKYYKNAWFCLLTVANFLDLNIISVPKHTRGRLVRFLCDLDQVNEDKNNHSTDAVDPNSCDAFLRRFRFCLCMIELLNKAYQKPINAVA